MGKPFNLPNVTFTSHLGDFPKPEAPLFPGTSRVLPRLQQHPTCRHDVLTTRVDTSKFLLINPDHKALFLGQVR